jgi:hypothetical protein
MKTKNLAIFICMFFLLNVSLAYAIDINPVLEFETDSTNVRATVQLQAVAVDALSNPGILWVKLYEDNIEIDSKKCGGISSCIFVSDVTHVSGGTFDYKAETRDKGGHTIESDPITVVFTGDQPPQNTGMNASPLSGVVYDPAQAYQFNATWTDDYNEVANVTIEHDFAGAMANYTVTTNVSDEYYYDYASIPAGNYTYTWHAVDQSGFSNSTGPQPYVVNQAPTALNLTASPSSWTANEGQETNVSCSADNPEVVVELYRNSSLIGSGVDIVSDVQTLTAGTYDYVCNTTGSQNYSAATDSNTLIISALPPVNVLWNNQTLNMGSTFQGVPKPDSENITAAGNNTNVDVACTSGNCSEITTNWTSTNMTGTETRQVDFVCDSLTPENYSAFFNVTSDEFAEGNLINVSCEVVPLPPVYVEWNQTNLDVAGERGTNVEGSVEIMATEDNTNVTVTCVSGNCPAVIDNNWTTHDMNNNQTEPVLFTCDSSTVGNYTALFNVSSDEDTTGGDLITVNCDITPPVFTTGNVLINEILYDGNVEPDSEWIELYNNDSNLINLNNWNITDSEGTFTIPNILIAPGEFIILVNNQTQFNSDFPTIPGGTQIIEYGASAGNLALANTDPGAGDDVYLYNSTGTLIDYINYGTVGTDPAAGVVQGHSIEREPLAKDTDNSSADFVDRATPTPGAEYIPPIYVSWNQSSLVIIAEQGSGNAENYADLTATGDNTNVAVICVAGNCPAVIDNNWTTHDMNNNQTETVTFTCDDSIAGDYIAVFNVTSDDDTEGGNSITVKCRIINYDVSLTAPIDALATTNATDVNYTLIVENTGSVADTFNITIENSNSTTTNLSADTISLNASESRNITLTVGDPAPGTYSATIRATSQGNNSKFDEVILTTIVSENPVHGVNIASSSYNQQTFTTANTAYTITITNTGNVNDTFDLTFSNPDIADTVELSSNTTGLLNPASSIDITLTVGDSTPGDYDITVTAVSQGNNSVSDITPVITTTVIIEPGQIKGTVQDNQGTDLSDVNVSVDGTGLYNLTKVGNYSIDITPGTYSVTATPPDNSHLSQTKSGQVVNPGLTTTVNFVLTQTGTINGTIYEFFTPSNKISGATVTARIGSTPYGSDVSDVNGNYEITGLAPGTYDVYVSHPSYTDTSKPLNDLLSGQTRTLDFGLWTP